MKKCTKCLIEKEINEFPKKAKSNDGHNPQCKNCVSLKSKADYEKNKERKKLYAIEYYKNNRERVLLNQDREKKKIAKKRFQEKNKEYIREYKKIYQLKNKETIYNYNREYKRQNRERINAQWRERRETDSLFKLRLNLSKRLWEVMSNKGFTKDCEFSEYIGCDPETLFRHIEKQFDSKMNWDNYGEYWEVDHIIPLSAGKTAEHYIELSHYKNLRPLEATTNRIKNGKILTCWQKFQRDKHEETDRAAGLPFDLNVNDFTLTYETITSEHRSFIQKYEWLGKVGFGVRWVFTARWQGNLAGVVMISEPNAYQFGKSEALIQRGAVSSWAPKNLNSKLVMFACNWMVRNTEKRYFVAYSDPSAGEIGTIYQACNFDYLGQTYGSSIAYILPNGKQVGSRYFTRTSAMKRWAREMGIEWNKAWCRPNGFQDPTLVPEEIKQYAKNKMKSCEQIKQEPKGKYILLLNYGKNKLKKTWVSKSYPKRKID